MKHIILLVVLCILSVTNYAQVKNKLPNRQATYCNPMNLDYGYCPIPNFVQNGKHRATADPVITVWKDKYFLFSCKLLFHFP